MQAGLASGQADQARTTQHEGSSHRKQGRDDRAAVGRKGPQRPPSRREAAPRAEGASRPGSATRASAASGGGEPVPGRQGELEGVRPWPGRRVTDPGNRGALDTFAARRPDGRRRVPLLASDPYHSGRETD